MLYNLSCSVKPGIVPALTQLPNNSKKKKKKENNYSDGLALWMEPRIQNETTGIKF